MPNENQLYYVNNQNASFREYGYFLPIFQSFQTIEECKTTNVKRVFNKVETILF